MGAHEAGTAGTVKELDDSMLPDIFPTGWHGVELPQFQPGDSVAVRARARSG